MNLKSIIQRDGDEAALLFPLSTPPYSFDFCQNGVPKSSSIPIKDCAFLGLAISRRLGNVSAIGFVPIRIDFLITDLG